MQKLFRLFINLMPLTLLSSACHQLPEQDNSPVGNFESLWTTVNEHYCFFSEKSLDWDEVHERYSAQIRENMGQRELFEVLAAMIGELRDGHTNLSAPFQTSYYRQWWSDYPQNFDSRLIEQYYFNFHYAQIGSWYYGILPSNVGYLQVPTFTTGLGHGNIDWVLNTLASCAGLIIDVRDNGGGNLSYAETLATHFLRESCTVAYMVHKTGASHDDFSNPFPVKYNPAPSGHFIWTKPVVVLTNRSTFSAGNFFVSVMKGLTGVKIAGAVTGGGSGMPFSYELPNGWGIRMSAVSVLDKDGNITEAGIAPDSGCEVALDTEAAASGVDSMIEFAENLIVEMLDEL